jgi:hypothetical protein
MCGLLSPFFAQLATSDSQGIFYKLKRFLVILIILNIFPRVYSQIYIAAGTELGISQTAQIAFFDTLLNHGTIVFTASYGADVTMLRDYWRNQGAGTITGSGTIKFAGTATQTINTNSTTGSFPSIQVNNANNLHLFSTDTDVKDSVIFVSGKIVLNLNDFNLGNGTNGVITGYDENRYFVTNGLKTDTAKGYLKRDAVSTTTVAYPVGTSVSSYTPASMLNNGSSDNYRVRVFDSAYENAISGFTQITGSVNKTWHILEATAGGTNAVLNLQHMNSTEGSIFTANKFQHFNTFYVGTTNNNAGDTLSKSKWANYKPTSANTGAHASTGTITTGSAIANATTTSTPNMTSVGYWSKSFWNLSLTPLPVELVFFTVSRAGNLTAKLDWMTASEKNNKGFRVQKSDDAIHFADWKWVDGRGTAVGEYLYTLLDPDCHIGHNYYRLIQVDEESTEHILPIRVVLFNSSHGNSGPNVSVYPVPFHSTLNIDMENTSAPEELYIVDMQGRKVMESKDLDKNMSSFSLDASSLAAGTYNLIVRNNQLNKAIRIVKN